MSELGSLLALEYGQALPAEIRTNHGFPVFGSNGEVGRHNKFLIQGPGIIVGRKGSVGAVTWSHESFWPIDTTYWVSCSEENKRWLYWLLAWLPLYRLDTSTGVPGLNRNDVYALKVYEPRSVEKVKLNQVLDTLDTAIHQTEAIVEKLKQVKQGLLHDLLTRGVDANGELRPSYEEAPHLYQDSKLGWIPRDWTVGSLSASCSEVVDCPHSTPVFTDAGVLVARTMHIKDGVFLEDQASRVSEKQYRERVARLTPEPGDVIFTREAPVGEAFVIPNGMKICLGQRVMLLRPRVNVLSAHYLLAQIYSGAVHERIRTLTSGTTNPHLNVAEVRDFMIPLPPYGEQLRIGERISAVSDRLGKEVCELSKLKLQKAGLMDDLLTGRVRVTPLLAQ